MGFWCVVAMNKSGQNKQYMDFFLYFFKRVDLLEISSEKKKSI